LIFSQASRSVTNREGEGDAALTGGARAPEREREWARLPERKGRRGALRWCAGPVGELGRAWGEGKQAEGGGWLGRLLRQRWLPPFFVFFSILFFQSLFPKRILNAKTNSHQKQA